MSLKDPRIHRTRRHELFDIVCLVICATTCGADGWDEIVDYGRAHEEWLKVYLRLPNGIPSADTIRRVMERIDPAAFERCFRSWVGAAFGKASPEAVALDGKRLRGHRNPLHMVSAWAHGENGLFLGQVATGEKSNEIKALPKLLETLHLKGSLVTIDAAGCQKEIALKIVEDCGADYLIAVKANQPELYQTIDEVFEGSAAAIGMPTQVHETAVEKGHGRRERRRASVIHETDWFPCAADWVALCCVVMVERWVLSSGAPGAQESYERRYFISSRKLSAKQAAKAVRGHWGVENKLHWSLDTAFAEDQSRIQNRVAATNLSLMRRLTLDLLAKVKGKNDSFKRLRKRCGWRPDFLLKVLMGQEI